MQPPRRVGAGNGKSRPAERTEVDGLDSLARRAALHVCLDVRGQARPPDPAARERQRLVSTAGSGRPAASRGACGAHAAATPRLRGRTSGRHADQAPAVEEPEPVTKGEGLRLGTRRGPEAGPAARRGPAPAGCAARAAAGHGGLGPGHSGSGQKAGQSGARPQSKKSA
jgi:hypothetical protein